MSSTQKENTARGIVYALGGPVLGIILWVILWRMGFIASLASFVIAWAAIRLYAKGAGVEVSRKHAPVLLTIITVGIVLAFLAGIIDDGLSYYSSVSHLSKSTLLTDSRFWSTMGENFKDSRFWSSYTNDILLAIVFAALGLYGTINRLLMKPTPVVKKPKATAPKRKKS